MRCVALPLIILALPEVLAFESWIVKHPLKKGREECYGCSRICRQVTHRQVLVLACMSTGHRVKPSVVLPSLTHSVFWCSLISIRFPLSFYWLMELASCSHEPDWCLGEAWRRMWPGWRIQVAFKATPELVNRHISNKTTLKVGVHQNHLRISTISSYFVLKVPMWWYVTNCH